MSTVALRLWLSWWQSLDFWFIMPFLPLNYRLWEGAQRISSFLPFPWLRQTQPPKLIPLIPTTAEMKANSQLRLWAPYSWGSSNPSSRNNPRPVTVDSVVEFWVLQTYGSHSLTSTGFLRRIKKFSALIIMKRMNLWHKIFSISSAWWEQRRNVFP